MTNIPELFGSMVFGDAAMKQYLPEDAYHALKNTMENGKRLDPTLANVIAAAMRDWAVERGATHYTHWFQPMTGITAEKHDSFIMPDGEGGVIMEFSGKELVKGESDASSFPSGGLRATFEARGYTAWDPTSYAFIKDNTLCIPTAFCSFGGEALDKKTPLLRSMEAVNREALRVLHLFEVGSRNTINMVYPTVGAEQEYFLIDRAMFDARRDLIFTGRTLFGAKPPRGQDLDDHYFGTIKPRVAAFMRDLDEELWKLGVYAKTEHNEAAPGQHELAPFYNKVNIATDHNQLTMETMKKLATRHGMVCLLHEKPFEGVNGSGKHINWSLQTDTGENLFEPGDTPHQNARFLLFLCAVLKGVDEHQDLLRISVAGPGNDHRLGSNEAPPAVVSLFLGDELTEILTAIEDGTPYDPKETVSMKVGVHVLPRFPKDTTDRNRTSPFAFTGNKFELRMLGSSASAAGPSIALNTIVADELAQFATRLESAADFQAELHNIIRDTIHAHKRIIFNGNGYDDKWVAEATQGRGLLNLKTTPDCLPYWVSSKNVALFTRHRVFTESELRSRCEILLDNYAKVLNIEALTMLDMARKDIYPATSGYLRKLSESVLLRKTALPEAAIAAPEQAIIEKLAALLDTFGKEIDVLENALSKAKECSDAWELSVYYRDYVLRAMTALRKTADEMEVLTAKSDWPFPTYGDILFSV